MLLNKAWGLSEQDVRRLVSLHPEFEDVNGAQLEQAERVLSMLAGQLELHSGQIAILLCKHPALLRSSPERVSETLAFLRQDLGFKQEEIGPLVVRFPNVLSYGVQAHLKPHLAYLASLGEQDVKGLILQRPHVLGEGFEKVVKFLQLCRVPRKEIFRLMRSYPLDYCLKIKAPAALAEIEASSSPGDPEEGAGGGAGGSPEKGT